MDKKQAFIISILLTGLLASSIYTFSSLLHDPEKRTSAIIIRVIDGDTLEIEDGSSIRLLNINSPEKNSPLHELSKSFLSSLVNKTVELDIVDRDKYNRLLVRVYSPDYINKELISEGLVSKFLVSNSELKSFAKLEEEAISKGKGIWKHSNYYGCFSTHINKNEELVSLQNKCIPINMNLWMLKDESRKIYVFNNITLKKSEEIFLHSSIGEDNEKELFWNSKTSIWNNDRDTLYLFDNEGKIVHHETYGY